MVPDVLQYITLAIALVGAFLGVLNTWRTFNNDRVRLRVKAVTLFQPGMRYGTLGIEVVNLSSFAVTVTHVGVNTSVGGRHLQIVNPQLMPGGQLPIRLEPRTGFTAITSPSAFQEPAFEHATCVYAKTACGLQIDGAQKDLAAVAHNLALTAKG